MKTANVKAYVCTSFRLDISVEAGMVWGNLEISVVIESRWFWTLGGWSPAHSGDW
jgi:hypothetical protein